MMDLAQAQRFLIELYLRDLSYHPDDNACDCIGHLVSDEECAEIQKKMDFILVQNWDWGLFDDVYGFELALINDELDKWIGSFEWGTVVA